MTLDMRKLVAIAALTALAACAAGPRPEMSRDRIDRVLAKAPGAAQPSRIVSTELAFARAAREDGQWTAFREYAADGALIHGRNGAIEAKPWLASLDDPDAAVQWAPREIWMSCDGALAISQGRFEDPEGIVGSYVTVWQAQRDRTYRYLYDMAQPDDPQPPAKAPEAPPEPGEIRVTAIDSVKGNVADCPRRGETAPARPASLGEPSGVSPDGTLAWRWAQEDGVRRFQGFWLTEGEWRSATDLAWSSPAEDE